MATEPSCQNSKRRYTLAELPQQCNPNAENPADLALWDAAHPVGNEVLEDMPAKRIKMKFPVTLTPDAGKKADGGD